MKPSDLVHVTHEESLQETVTLYQQWKLMCRYLPVFLCLFESLRRDLNEAKEIYVSECYLVCRFVIMELRLRLKFR